MAGVLYRKERELLEYLAQYQRQFGYSPTLREMASATHHKSVSTIHAIIRNLVDKGNLGGEKSVGRVLG